MAREMAAMMVGIILAGRTGAAFAAQIGTMQANEEIDALSTLGLSPMEFLVLPRMLALILMTPLLCLYADLMGILGGAVIGVTVLDLPPITYLQETQGAIRLTDFAGGLIKSAVYGVVVAARSTTPRLPPLSTPPSSLSRKSTRVAASTAGRS
jgi:phospholipid/cholesterol/gamma-HCH transport system permease protein